MFNFFKVSKILVLSLLCLSAIYFIFYLTMTEWWRTHIYQPANCLIISKQIQEHVIGTNDQKDIRYSGILNLSFEIEGMVHAVNYSLNDTLPYSIKNYIPWTDKNSINKLLDLYQINSTYQCWYNTSNLNDILFTEPRFNISNILTPLIILFVIVTYVGYTLFTNIGWLLFDLRLLNLRLTSRHREASQLARDVYGRTFTKYAVLFLIIFLLYVLIKIFSK